MKTSLNFEEIFAAATIEQKIIWNDLYLKYGQRMAISQLTFTGDPATSELVVYTARKMYLAYSIHMSCELSTTVPQMNMFDESNALNFRFGIPAAYWDVTAVGPKYMGQAIPLENALFSRIVLNGAAFVDFVGFRIIY